MRRQVRAFSTLCVLAIVAVAGCGSSGSGSSSKSKLPARIGKGEGALNLVLWVGYGENGSNDPKVDWVHPFEQQSGCKVNIKYGQSSDEMVTLMRQGGGSLYDGVSASGDASNRLIANGDVTEINTSLIKDYRDIIPKLQNAPNHTVHGRHYGVPIEWGPDYLLYNTDEIKAEPTSWSTVFNPKTPYAGRITAFDSPIYIADAALYLKTTRPELKITNPYELTAKQLDAAVTVLKAQRKNIKKYWALYSDEVDLFSSKDVVAGQGWPYQLNLLQQDKKPIAGVVPREGVTGWTDTWMMSSHAQHPNCMYLWMNYFTTPKVQAQVSQWSPGQVPSNAQTCSILGPDLCAQYHIHDDAFFNRISFWKTPEVDCGDSRGKTCTSYTEWTQRWSEIRG